MRARRTQNRYEGGRVAWRPILGILVRSGVSPNAITWIGFAGALAVSGLILWRQWLVAGFLFVAIGLMDSLDGTLARLTGRVSKFGAFLDSTLDRMSEAVVLGALGVTLAQDGRPWAVGACFVALGASFLVSYTRARAEGLGISSNKGGLMSRPERLVLTGAGIFFASVWYVLETVVVVLAVLTLLTVAQRLYYVRRALPDAPASPNEESPTS
jgi:CDP-diacylglycerol--glycerol-3-phosphate 3-phosphatidyltransferase